MTKPDIGLADSLGHTQTFTCDWTGNSRNTIRLVTELIPFVELAYGSCASRVELQKTDSGQKKGTHVTRVKEKTRYERWP